MKLTQFFYLFVVSAVFYGVTSGVAVQLVSGQPVEKSIFEGVFFAIGMGLFQAFLMVSEWMRDRKSTRLNSSHQIISYAVFCLKKKKTSTSCLCLNDHSRG